MEMIVEALFEFVLIYPGALIRRLIFRQKSLRSYLDDSNSINVLTAVVFFDLLIVLVLLLEFLNS